MDDPTLKGIIRQAEDNRAELGRLSKEQEKLTAGNEEYRGHLNLVPAREQQLSEIVRDYDLFKQDYENLEKQKLQSEMTASVEENQQGQQFRLVDPPSLPVKPSGPKRLKISLGISAGGFLVGSALAVLTDMRRGAFYSERALGQALSFPLIVGMPFVYTPSERRTRICRITFEWIWGCLMTLAVFAAEFYVFRRG